MAPCIHFTVEKACSRGYQPDERCAMCQLYQSDWEAPAERMVKWLALFGMNVSSHPDQSYQEALVERKRNSGKWVGSPNPTDNSRSPREAYER